MQIIKMYWKTFILIPAFLILVLLARDFNSRMLGLREQQNELYAVSTEHASWMSTQVALQTQVAFAGSDDYVEQYAYEKGKLKKPGDTVIIPVPVGSEDDSAVVVAAPEETPATRWQLWLSLLMDVKAH